MAKFEIGMTRAMVQQASIEIEAETLEQALEIAKSMRECVEWSATDIEYSEEEVLEAI